LETIFDLAGKRYRLAEIENQMSRDGFWGNPEAATAILRERTQLANRIDQYTQMMAELEENELLLSMALDEEDEKTQADVARQADTLAKRIHTYSINITLVGDHDASNAIVAINAGAGGTDAQDWAEMMFRMYLRWAEQRGFASEIIDLQPGDEAGIKSTTFTVKGQYAFGYLKSEIRRSPAGAYLPVQCQR
jgi:peptide chain release factor 2